jgi:hypothetical protein
MNSSLVEIVEMKNFAALSITRCCNEKKTDYSIDVHEIFTGYLNSSTYLSFNVNLIKYDFHVIV